MTTDRGAGLTPLRPLRQQMRWWRRGHSTKTYAEAFEDGYVWLVAALMIGASTVQLVINLQPLSAACEQCNPGLLPWLAATFSLWLTVCAANLFGPVFVSPAENFWLATAPVDRARLARPRLLFLLFLLTLTAGLVTAVGTAIAVPRAVSFLGMAGLTALAAAATVLALASAQPKRIPLPPVLLVLCWLVLFTAAAGAPLPAPTSVGVLAGTTAVLLTLLTWASVAAARALPRLRRRDVASGGRLAPGLSGALAALDLSLAHDVIESRRWHQTESVTVRRGGPSGLPALAHREVRRIRRNPRPLIQLLAGLAIPWIVVRTESGNWIFIVTALTLFATGVSSFSGFRVLTRSASLTRSLPFASWQQRFAIAGVPIALLTLAGLASTPALIQALDLPLTQALGCGTTLGLTGAAAGLRWMCGAPPDFNKPLLSTPAGAVPPNLYGSLVKGFDVLVLGVLPLIVNPGWWWVSGLIALALIGVLLRKD